MKKIGEKMFLREIKIKILLLFRENIKVPIKFRR